jgi:hypothetical protein
MPIQWQLGALLDQLRSIWEALVQRSLIFPKKVVDGKYVRYNLLVLHFNIHRRVITFVRELDSLVRRQVRLRSQLEDPVEY